ncbi:MAG TPA: hypothetical protein VJN50_03485 [Actinomycetota bacterium]|nr:hypothetical protein [Actinomycetota bacterium]
MSEAGIARADRAGIAAAAIAGATDAAYVAVILQEGEGMPARVLFVAGFMGAATACVAVGVLSEISDRARHAILAFAATGLLALGVLAIFSIGWFLIVAGALSYVAWFRSPGAQPGLVATSISAAVASVLVLVAGIALT